ncbi:MAG: RsfS/YbeB/iojap family protein, partial [Lachnospiraceae bacterium]|nr:RsfS/YbeB/iojap family protein [Lachnospiraceae bacterium]
MTREILSQIYKVLDDKKGIDIRMIDIGKISSMADYFVIASANNDNQIQAMVDAVEENLQKIDVVP